MHERKRCLTRGKRRWKDGWMDGWAKSGGLKLKYEITSHLPVAFRFTWSADSMVS